MQTKECNENHIIFVTFLVYLLQRFKERTLEALYSDIKIIILSNY